MIIVKGHSKVSITTTNDYLTVFIIRRQSDFVMLTFHNMHESNDVEYRIYGSLEGTSIPDDDPDPTKGIWVELTSNILAAKNTVTETLSDPWPWLLVQVKNRINNQSATVTIFHKDVR